MAAKDLVESGHVDGFVSYCRTDAVAATALVELAATLGRTLWLDTADLAPATVWRDELRRAIESADAIVCLVSRDWLASGECRRELNMAVELGKRLVPVQLEQVPYDDQPVDLLNVQWIDATTEPLDAVSARIFSAIDKDHERVREHTRWVERAARWNEGDRDSSLLARGHDLREAESWLATGGQDPHPMPLQIEFVSASRRAERRRARVLLTAISAAAIVALVLAGVAAWQRSEAIAQRNTAEARRLVAESQRLAAEAQGEMDTDPEAALILASNSWRASPTAHAATVLRQALSKSLVRSTVPAKEKLWSLVPAASGLVITTSAPHGRALQARRNGVAVSAVDVGATVQDLLTNADGTVGLATTENRAVGWTLDGDTLVASAPARHVQVAAMSTSGNLWAVLDDRNRVWAAGPNAPRWTPLRDLPRLPDAYLLEVSADGRTLAVGDGDKVVVRLPSGSVRTYRVRTPSTCGCRETVVTWSACPAPGQARSCGSPTAPSSNGSATR